MLLRTGKKTHTHTDTEFNRNICHVSCKYLGHEAAASVNFEQL